MSYEEAMTIFKKQFPELTIIRCVDYSNDHYILEAVEDPNIIDYNSPYYAVAKDDKAVSYFIPSFDLDAFFDAMENRTVYITY